MKVTAKHMNDPDRLADLNIVVFGSDLHAPVLERILEIPIDIYDGMSFSFYTGCLCKTTCLRFPLTYMTALSLSPKGCRFKTSLWLLLFALSKV